MKSVKQFLLNVWLGPFMLMLMNGAGDSATIDDGKSDEPTPEEAERQAAIDRGDVIAEPDDDLDPELLAKVAGEEIKPDEKEDDKPIPKARFNEVNEKAKAAAEENERLKAENEALKAGKTTEKTAEELAEETRLAEEAEIENPTTIAGMEAKRDRLQEQADEMLIEVGPQDEERKAIVKQVNELNKEIAKKELRAENHVEQTKADLQRDIQAATKECLALYPFLDARDKEGRDVDAILAVNHRRDELVAGGKSFVEALRQAVDEKGPKFAKSNGFTVDDAKAEEVRKKREEDAIRKAASASLKQPARLPSQGDKEGFKVNIDDLTGKQIAAMDEKEKARLRGDTL
jgi:hypothetical protein